MGAADRLPVFAGLRREQVPNHVEPKILGEAEQT
jgi:hypothetical protein